MKISELIECLSQLPQDLEVMTWRPRSLAWDDLDPNLIMTTETKVYL